MRVEDCAVQSVHVQLVLLGCGAAAGLLLPALEPNLGPDLLIEFFNFDIDTVLNY